MSEQVINAIRDLRLALTPFGKGVESAPTVDVEVRWIETTTFSSAGDGGREFIPVVTINGYVTNKLFVADI